MFKKLIAIIFAVLLIASTAIAFDKTPGSFKEFEGWVSGSTERTVVVSDGWLDITIVGHAEGLYPDWDAREFCYRRGSGIFAQSGSGYHIGGGWIITNAHVIRPSRVEVTITPNFAFIVPVDKVIDIDFFVGPGLFGTAHAYLIWVNEEYDMAMLWVDPRTAPFLKDYGYRTTWTWGEGMSLIEEGDVVATIVRVRDTDNSKLWHSEIRWGKVINSRPAVPPGYPNELLAWFSLNDFTTDIQVYPGDSGSPIFAFNNGKPVIIGLLRAGVYSANGTCFYSYATRIDLIHRKSLER